MRIDYISVFIMALSTVLAVVNRNNTDPVFVGMFLLYVQLLNDNLLWFFKICAMFEARMVSFDRCLKLLDTP